MFSPLHAVYLLEIGRAYLELHLLSSAHVLALGVLQEKKNCMISESSNKMYLVLNELTYSQQFTWCLVPIQHIKTPTLTPSAHHDRVTVLMPIIVGSQAICCSSKFSL